MPTCLKDSVNVIFSGIDGGFCSLNLVPLTGPDFELDLVLYRITKLVLKARLYAELFYAFSRTFLQSVRVFTEHFENLSFFTEALPLFNDRSINRWMGFLLLNSVFELTNVLVFLGQEIEVGLKVGVDDEDPFVVMRDSPKPDRRPALVSLMVEV